MPGCTGQLGSKESPGDTDLGCVSSARIKTECTHSVPMRTCRIGRQPNRAAGYPSLLSFQDALTQTACPNAACKNPGGCPHLWVVSAAATLPAWQGAEHCTSPFVCIQKVHTESAYAYAGRYMPEAAWNPHNNSAPWL